MSEANDLKKFIVSYLNGAGWDVWANNSGQVKTGAYMVRLSRPFLGDVIGMDPDCGFVNIEVKIDDDEPTKGQIDMHYKVVMSKHGVAAIVRSEEWFLEWYKTHSQKGQTVV